MAYLRVTPVAVSEGDGSISFVVRLDAPSANEVRVNYGTDVGTATYGGSQDLVFQQGTLIFAPGETTKTVQIALTNGTVAEATEVFWLDLNSAVNAVVPLRWNPGLIFDDDGARGTPALTVSDVVVDESTGTASAFVWLDRPSTLPVSVGYATADGTALAGADFSAAAGLLSFAPGEMVKTVNLAIANDPSAENDEDFRLVLANPTGATLADGVGQVLIGRNDAAPESTPQILARPIAASEGDTFASFVVTLSAPSQNEVRVNYGTDVGTATYGGSQDLAFQQGTLVFAPGETTTTVQVLLTDDTVAERDEVFWLDLNSPTNAVVPQRWTPALVVDDDGATGTPGLRVSDVVVDETTQRASVFVLLDRPSVSTVTVGYATGNGTAAAGSDYTAANGTLSFAPGETVKTVTVDIANDAEGETDEFFNLVLANPSGATLVDATGQWLIGRNDTAPVSTPHILARPIAVGEGETFANFVVSLSAPSQNEVRVNYGTDVGTATYGGSQDLAFQQGTLVFAPGETTRTVQVLLTDGTVDEDTEVFWLDLNSPTNAVVPQRWTPALVVDNDGATGTPGLSISDIVVDENAQRASVFVSMNQPSVSTVTVAFATADINAAGTADYTAAAGTLSFAPGETVKTITVELSDDALAESNEAFSVLLSNPSGATLSDSVGQVTIGRNDTRPLNAPQILSTPITVSEADTFAAFIVSLSAPARNEVRVNYGTDVGTATHGGSQDYIFQQGTLVFAPGETQKTVSVLLTDGTVAESTETFTLDLNGAVNASVPQRFTTATILDNDGAGAVYSLGRGNDLYTLASVLDRIAESPFGGIDTVRAGFSVTLPDNVERLVLTGTALNGIGNAGPNTFRGTAANNTFDGREGIDVMVYGDAVAVHTFSGSPAQLTVTSAAEGSDTLLGMERVQFSDTILAIDTVAGGNVWGAYAMFNAAFNRGPDTQELSQWTAQLDLLGGNLRDLAQAMINHYAPGVSDEALVTHLWGTIIGTPIPLDALSTYVGLVVDGSQTQASLLELVTTLEPNTVELAGIAGQVLALDPAFFPPLV